MVIVKEEKCNVSKITYLVESYVPQAKLETNVGAELSYILPHESSDKFEDLFTELEENRTQLGISSYGASVTTMEEVFLRLVGSFHFINCLIIMIQCTSEEGVRAVDKRGISDN